ncbi:MULTISPECIES: BlaR1 family beta-lactam sensor/signal transducer [unclassified Niallia]|uniref:BlaR1 family beta-lactam sensor/signal transducer n=1 Tax=unclassified Niallia TaxID=2837522 RepID=UPI0013CFEC79
MVVTRLLLSTLVVSLLILIILLIKRVFYNQLSQQSHYKIWCFLFAPIITCVIPWDFLRFQEIFQYMQNLLFNEKEITRGNQRFSGLDISQTSNHDFLNDFSISVNKTNTEFFQQFFFVIWIIGIMVFIASAIYAIYQIRQIKKSSTSIKDQNINELLEECKEIVGVKRKIILRETALINSPITLGLWKPYVFLPQKTKEEFSLSKIKYVFLHELCHQKSKDSFVNYLMWLVQIIYWFNPLVWLALKKMRIDRELACDASVLSLLDESRYTEYGYTIIHFADKKFNRPYKQFSTGIGGTKEQLKRRIQSIANYRVDSPLLKWKSKVIYALLAMVVLLFTSLSSALASSDDKYHFNEKNVTYEDLSSYFNGYKGSFVLYDPIKKQYQIYNREMSEQRVSPNSTYKIYSALFALETNVISTTSNEQLWDGTAYPFEKWNTNQNLSTALENSVNWYFQQLDREVGKKKLQSYFHKLNYGNENLSGNIDHYWMESSLKISPIEQVQLLFALEENKLGFKEENIRSVNNAIFIDEQKQAQLYGKTGTGTINGKEINGWFVGFVKKDGYSYYFSINIQNKTGKANGKKAANIAKRILHDKNIF